MVTEPLYRLVAVHYLFFQCLTSKSGRAWYTKLHTCDIINMCRSLTQLPVLSLIWRTSFWHLVVDLKGHIYYVVYTHSCPSVVACCKWECSKHLGDLWVSHGHMQLKSLSHRLEDRAIYLTHSTPRHSNHMGSWPRWRKSTRIGMQNVTWNINDFVPPLLHFHGGTSVNMNQFGGKLQGHRLARLLQSSLSCSFEMTFCLADRGENPRQGFHTYTIFWSEGVGGEEFVRHRTCVGTRDIAHTVPV